MSMRPSLQGLFRGRAGAVAETTALGAAYAAGLAVGFWKNQEDIRLNWGIDKTWEPTEGSEAGTENYRMWKKAVTRTFDWVE